MKETRFKDTEIGRIPEDWDVYLLGNKAEIYRGGSPRPIEEYLTELPTGINWIKIGDVKSGDKYIRKTAERIKPSGASRSRSVEPGDFILSNSMSFGRPYILAIDGCIHDGWLVIKKYQLTFDKDFLYYVLGSSAIVEQYKSMAAGSSVQNLNKDKVAGVKVITPVSVEEQKSIASALTSIDNLISSLDKLIEKKKNIKQGTMQQLLTGKKRLKGFSEPWEENTLQSLGYFDGKSVTPYLSPNDVYYEYSMPAFDECKKPNISKGTEMLSARVAINGEVLLINKLNVRQKRIWYIERCEDNAVCSGEFLPYKSSVIDLTLLRHILLTDKVVQDFIDMSTGTSNSQRRIRPKNVLDYKVNIPTDKKEQKAIADVLTSMDNEISALEAKKDKYEYLKQGMMQQLLTGKIRLID